MTRSPWISGADPKLRALDLDPQRYDGYVRNANVFGDGITIEDNLAVIVDYAEGPTLTYSLNAHSPWEGYRVAINGTEGRVELDVVERGAAIPSVRGQVEVDPGDRQEYRRRWLRPGWRVNDSSRNGIGRKRSMSPCRDQEDRTEVETTSSWQTSSAPQSPIH